MLLQWKSLNQEAVVAAAVGRECFILIIHLMNLSEALNTRVGDGFLNGIITRKWIARDGRD